MSKPYDTNNTPLDTICANCGYRFGSHYAYGPTDWACPEWDEERKCLKRATPTKGLFTALQAKPGDTFVVKTEIGDFYNGKSVRIPKGTKAILEGFFEQSYGPANNYTRKMARFHLPESPGQKQLTCEASNILTFYEQAPMIISDDDIVCTNCNHQFGAHYGGANSGWDCPDWTKTCGTCGFEHGQRANPPGSLGYFKHPNEAKKSENEMPELPPTVSVSMADLKVGDRFLIREDDRGDICVAREDDGYPHYIDATVIADDTDIMYAWNSTRTNSERYSTSRLAIYSPAAKKGFQFATHTAGKPKELRVNRLIESVAPVPQKTPPKVAVCDLHLYDKFVLYESDEGWTSFRQSSTYPHKLEATVILADGVLKFAYNSNRRSIKDSSSTAGMAINKDFAFVSMPLSVYTSVADYVELVVESKPQLGSKPESIKNPAKPAPLTPLSEFKVGDKLVIYEAIGKRDVWLNPCQSTSTNWVKRTATVLGCKEDGYRWLGWDSSEPNLHSCDLNKSAFRTCYQVEGISEPINATIEVYDGQTCNRFAERMFEAPEIKPMTEALSEFNVGDQLLIYENDAGTVAFTAKLGYKKHIATIIAKSDRTTLIAWDSPRSHEHNAPSDFKPADFGKLGSKPFGQWQSYVPNWDTKLNSAIEWFAEGKQAERVGTKKEVPSGESNSPPKVYPAIPTAKLEPRTTSVLTSELKQGDQILIYESDKGEFRLYKNDTYKHECIATVLSDDLVIGWHSALGLDYYKSFAKHLEKYPSTAYNKACYLYGSSERCDKLNRPVPAKTTITTRMGDLKVGDWFTIFESDNGFVSVIENAIYKNPIRASVLKIERGCHYLVWQSNKGNKYDNVYPDIALFGMKMPDACNRWGNWLTDPEHCVEKEPAPVKHGVQMKLHEALLGDTIEFAVHYQGHPTSINDTNLPGDWARNLKKATVIGKTFRSEHFANRVLLGWKEDEEWPFPSSPPALSTITPPTFAIDSVGDYTKARWVDANLIIGNLSTVERNEIAAEVKKEREAQVAAISATIREKEAQAFDAVMQAFDTPRKDVDQEVVNKQIEEAYDKQMADYLKKQEDEINEALKPKDELDSDVWREADARYNAKLAASEEAEKSEVKEGSSLGTTLALAGGALLGAMLSHMSDASGVRVSNEVVSEALETVQNDSNEALTV